MVSISSSAGGEACRGAKMHKRNGRRNSAKADATCYDHNSECDASSELTSDGEMEDREAEQDTVAGGRKSASLNRTFLVPPGESSLAVAEVSPVVLRTRHRIKPQRPWSLSGLTLGGQSTAAARWTASETALNHLLSSPTLSPCSAVARPLMCHASTQKDSAEVDGIVGSSSMAGLSSCGGGSSGTGALRQRRRRHSARFRNVKSLARRADIDLTPQLNASEAMPSHSATLQARLSASAASASCSSSEGSAGSGSQRSRRVVKSSTLTRLSVESNCSSGSVSSCAPVAVVGPMVIAQSSPIKGPATAVSSGVATSTAPSTNNSSPRSTAPSDGEHCLAHADETSNFSEQAWDNYLVR